MTNKIIQEAMELALTAHEGQKYGNLPYSIHLFNVVETVKELRDGYAEDNEVAAAWLHDSLEDTTLTAEEISKRCGEEVTRVVSLVTNKGKSRKEHMALTLPGVVKDPIASVIKIADRVSNVRFCATKQDRKMFDMYAKERDEFFFYMSKSKYIPQVAFRTLESAYRSFPEEEPIKKREKKQDKKEVSISIPQDGPAIITQSAINIGDMRRIVYNADGNTSTTTWPGWRWESSVSF